MLFSKHGFQGNTDEWKRSLKLKGLVLPSILFFMPVPEATIVSQDVTGNRAKRGGKKWRIVYRGCTPSVHEVYEGRNDKVSGMNGDGSSSFLERESPTISVGV